MSQTSLGDLANEHPELRGALQRIGGWLDQNSRQNTIDPSKLARQFSDIRATDLALALLLMAQAGLLVRVYKVVTPSGVLADGEFEDPTRIPDRLSDRFANYFDTAEADIVPVFRRDSHER